MDVHQATEFLRPAVPAGPQAWADLGAGTGTFSLALLALLGPGSRVLAVDRDPRSLAALRERARREGGGAVVALEGDLRSPGAIPELAGARLQGALLANALHFVPDPGPVLAQVAGLLLPGGRIVVVEYGGRLANPWVPYPLDPDRLARAAAAASLPEPTVVNRRPSAYGGVMYCAVLG
jgi:SAM-dependent methyltransferase